MANSPLSMLSIELVTQTLSRLTKLDIYYDEFRTTLPADQPFLKEFEARKSPDDQDKNVVREIIGKQEIYANRWYGRQEVAYCFLHHQDRVDGVLEQVTLLLKGRVEIPALTSKLSCSHPQARIKMVIFEDTKRYRKFERQDQYRKNGFSSWKDTDLRNYYPDSLFTQIHYRQLP